MNRLLPLATLVFLTRDAHAQSLTASEAAILRRGEIPDSQRVGGGVMSLIAGFGIGQAMQGRWSETGWIFTVGESAAVVAYAAGIDGVGDCLLPFQGECREGRAQALMYGGFVALLALRVWEVGDAWTGPVRHNRRVREIRARVTPGAYVAPATGGSGAVAGVTIRF